MKEILIGADHGAYGLKEHVKEHLDRLALAYIDMGTYSTDSVDYSDIGHNLAEKISNHQYERGILMCGTGIGMSMVANRYKGVRATLCHNDFTAEMSRKHNDSNILVMGGRVIGNDYSLADKIFDIWLNTPFEGGRHLRRIQKIDE